MGGASEQELTYQDVGLSGFQNKNLVGTDLANSYPGKSKYNSLYKDRLRGTY
jgi:hypothetical protein